MSSSTDSDSDSDSVSVKGDSQSQTSTQQAQAGSQSKYNRTWKLKNAEMRILDFSVRVPGKPMNLKMEFTFPNKMVKIVDLPFTPAALKDSRMTVINKCEKYIFLEDLETMNQNKYFPDYLDQQIKLYDEENDPSLADRKPTKEFAEPTVEQIGDKFYWIAGPEEVHHLNHNKTEEMPFSKKLTPDEIASLPIEPIYVGMKKPAFLNDEKGAMKLLLEIIANMNDMQEPKFHSFPLASFCSNLCGMLYKFIVQEQRFFATRVVLSGSGNTYGTGKSLMTSCWQLTFFGEYPSEQQIKITQSSIFEELDAGRPVYLREWVKQAETLNLVIPMIWERLGRRINHKYQAVNSVVFIEANLDPSDVIALLKNANESKTVFIASGSKPLSHDRRKAKCKEMIAAAKQLYVYCPVLLGIGLSCMLTEIGDDDLPQYDGLLKTDKDDRTGQSLLDYDRVHKVLSDAITEFELDPPLLFQKSEIDRTALTFYNGKEEVISLEEMGESIAAYLVDEGLDQAVEYFEKRSCFKLRLALNSLPDEIASAVKTCTKETTLAFGEKPAVKVRLLSTDLLTDESVASLKSLNGMFNFTDWVDAAIIGCTQEEKNLGIAFFQYFDRPSKHSNPLDVEDEFLDDAGASKKANKIPPVESFDDKMCTVPGCQAFVAKTVFKSVVSCKKHFVSKGHLLAASSVPRAMAKKGKKHSKK